MMRPFIWSGERPEYCQITAITGMRISGKISTGVRNAASVPAMAMKIAITMKVSGRARARRTMAIMMVGRAGL